MKRKKIKNFYDKNLRKLPVILPENKKNKISSLHLYVIRLKNQSISFRNEVIKKLRKKGIGVNIHYIPIHLQPYFRSLGFKKGMFPASEEYYKTAISLPIHPGLKKRDLIKILKVLKNLL